MKKIIIVNNNLNTGGVQISLINLLKEIHGLYDITLLLFAATPESLSKIPDSVKVIIEKSPFRYLGMSLQESKRSFRTLCGKIFWTSMAKVLGRSRTIRLMLPLRKKIRGYDCAISYLHEASQKSFYGGCNEFVLKKIEASKKITWIHCDFRLCGANNKKSIPIYQAFDTVIACSEGAKTAFIECMPSLASKCVVVRNCNDYPTIRALSQATINYPHNTFNIVTVARLSAEKGIDRMLRALASIQKQGFQAHYHIVGAGQELAHLKQLTIELALTDSVTFHGNQANPYPYIAAADLLVLPSYHEAAPMVFDEAASLGTPVLATETTSTQEMILNENAGFVCENSQKGLTEALLGILEDPKKLEAISQHLKNKRFHNQKSIETVLQTF